MGYLVKKLHNTCLKLNEKFEVLHSKKLSTNFIPIFLTNLTTHSKFKTSKKPFNLRTFFSFKLTNTPNNNNKLYI